MSHPFRGRQVKITIGLALALAGHGGIVWSVHAAICHDVRSAVATRASRPDLEGRVVAVTGPIESAASVEDPDFVPRDGFIALTRRVEAPRLDSDDDLHWDWAKEVATSKGGAKLAEGAWFVERATVGGIVVPVAGATHHRGLPPLDLTVEQVNLAVATREYELVWDGASRAFYVPAFSGGRGGVALKQPKGEFIGRLRFEGIRAGTVVTVVGRLRQGALAPVPLAAEGPESVLIVRGEKTPEAIAGEVETRVIRVSFLGLMVLATAGLVLVFMPPYMVVGWFFFMGVGPFFGKLAAEGFRAALPHALFIIYAIGSLIVTMFVAFLGAPHASVIWLVMFAALVLALKRLSVADELEEEI